MRPIARWNAVPGLRAIAGQPVRVGVCAHHIHGIDRVVLAAGGEQFTVYAPSVNPDTGAVEYWIELPPLPPALHELSAVVHANDGSSRALTGPLTVESSGTGEHGLTIDATNDHPAVFVSHLGNDSDDGTRSSPFATIGKALLAVPDGGDIVLLDPGRYDPPYNQFGHLRRRNQRWITIRPDDALEPNSVTLAWATHGDRRRMMASTDRLRLRGLALDFERMSVVYAQDTMMTWLDRCQWFDREGFVQGRGNTRPFQNAWYATNCLARDTCYAFAGAALVSNCAAHRVSGDVFQMARAVVNTPADNINGTINGHHTDLFQCWGPRENTLYQQIKATNLIACQSIFLEPTREQHNQIYTMRDTAFVDVEMHNNRVHAWNANEQRWDDRGTPPFSQVYGHLDHCLFERAKLPHQRLGFRDGPEVSAVQRYTGEGVVFRDCLMHADSHLDAEGVTQERVTRWVPGDVNYDGRIDFGDLNAALNRGEGFERINEILSNFGRTQ